MTKLKVLFSLFLAMALAACGGGGSATGSGGFVNQAGVADVVIVLSAPTIANDGTQTVTATATALDANRNSLPNVTITIAVDSGTATVTNSTTTATSGVTATIGVGGNATPRTIKVTATNGGIVRSADLKVIDVGTSTVTASDLVLVLSASSIPNNGTSTVTATATALDGKRNALPGASVAITVDNGAVVRANSTITDTTGVVSGAVTIGSDRSLRTIKVTATSGSISRTATLAVTDSSSGDTPVAADLSLALSSPNLVNSGTSTILATATAVDKNRNALPGIPITIAVDASALATVSGPVTNAAGVVTANVGIGADRSNRLVTVTATSGTLTRSASFRVIGARLTSSLSPLVTAGSDGNQIEFTLVDTNSTAMPGQSISVTAPGLPSATGTTDLNGKYVFTYKAPSATGLLVVTASAAGDTRVETVQVQTGGGSVPQASEKPLSASVAPTPSTVSVNAPGSSTNQVELRALFVGTNNQPISKIRVRFDLDGNLTNSDAQISWLGGDYAYSDATGVARGTLIPRERSSPTNGVTVRACWDVGDFPITSCPNAARATMTITSEALSVNIRTNELVKIGSTKLTYIKEFVVMVVDAAGVAKPDVTITPSVDLPSYYKGYYVYNSIAKRWNQILTLANDESYQWSEEGRRWGKVAPPIGPLLNGTEGPQPSCPNEDVNRNGVREAPTYSATAVPPALASRQEDLNWNGDLDPRKADVAIKMVGSNKTDSNGLAVVQIEYGKSVATWVDFVITVTASGISGTEARARYSGLLYGLGNLPAASVDVTDENVAPAFVISPYGRGTVCTDTK